MIMIMIIRHSVQCCFTRYKNVQLSLTNPRDAKPCQKFLQLKS